MRESSMPIEAAVALQNGIAAKKAAAVDLRSAIFLIPLAMCLLSIILAIKSPAFAAAVAMIGAD
jgi:hypothetical protein